MAICDKDGNGLISFEEWIEYLDATRLCLPKDFEGKVQEELAKITKEEAFTPAPEPASEDGSPTKSLAEAKLYRSIQRRKKALDER